MSSAFPEVGLDTSMCREVFQDHPPACMSVSGFQVGILVCPLATVTYVFCCRWLSTEHYEGVTLPFSQDDASFHH